MVERIAEYQAAAYIKARPSERGNGVSTLSAVRDRSSPMCNEESWWVYFIDSSAS